MGRRYKAILNYLHEPFECLDPLLGGPKRPREIYDRFIIASPTPTHLAWVCELDEYNKPILCEKPLSKDIDEASTIARCRSPLTMQMQYSRLAQDSLGKSFYNYFHHGQDGLVWDCFQIIALAKSEIELYEDSPVWRCMINGRHILRGHMDFAYVEYVRAWMNGEVQPSKSQLLEWHHKVKEFEEKWTSNKFQS